MNRIVLARHGRPTLDLRTPIPGHALGAWLDAERVAPLDPTSRPSAELERLVRTATRVIASPLRRSLDSARVLAPSVTALVETDVREAALPSAFRSELRFRPVIWTGLARTAWFCGWSAGVESFAAARQRAARAARALQDIAAGQGEIVVIGHGLMNSLIGAALRALGWRGPRFPSGPHWGFGAYTD